jgi:hypothetical protein
LLVNHDAIKNWVLDCTKAKDASVYPGVVRNEFYVEAYSYDSSDNPQLPLNVRLPSHQETALLTLSKEIALQRRFSANRADKAYNLWQITSITSIILGMFTTILVSLSSTVFGRGDGLTQTSIRILAIVFPALGTAAAAIIAFYGPQAEWTQASRTLASLTQLHDQIASGIWKLNCMQKENDEFAGRISAQLDEWSKRYVDIQTVSAATGASAGASTTPTTAQPENKKP